MLYELWGRKEGKRSKQRKEERNRETKGKREPKGRTRTRTEKHLVPCIWPWGNRATNERDNMVCTHDELRKKRAAELIFCIYICIILYHIVLFTARLSLILQRVLFFFCI